MNFTLDLFFSSFDFLHLLLDLLFVEFDPKIALFLTERDTWLHR